MHPRTYALTLSAAALSLFLGVAGTNLLIDPMGVFGTRLLSRSLDDNERYATLAEYQSQRDRYDGLFFGSSRLQTGVPLDALSCRATGVKGTEGTVKCRAAIRQRLVESLREHQSRRWNRETDDADHADPGGAARR
jgi:hypothetical protein